MNSYIKIITGGGDRPFFFKYEGDELVATNYWTEEAPNFFLSFRANHVRLLVPKPSVSEIIEMWFGAKSIYVSVLEHSLWDMSKYCVEWIVDNGTNRPWFCYLTPRDVDFSGPFPSANGAWKASVWNGVDGLPCKRIERTAHLAIASRMPWLLPRFEEDSFDTYRDLFR
jgi:hypothetical protein